MASEVPAELKELYIATYQANPEEPAKVLRWIALAAVLDRHEQMVVEQASEKLMARAGEYADSLTGPRATWRRALEAAARHILPTPQQVAEAIADGTAVVVGCPSLDDEPTDAARSES